MNKNTKLLLTALLAMMLFSACQQKKGMPSASEHGDTLAAEAPESASEQQSATFPTVTKGRIESEREIPVYSRISEQIVMFAAEKAGQYVKKGQVVVRLSSVAMQEKILHSRAKLEKAEFQYQAILMGQGYKRDHLDEAPDNIKRLARINSGYNEAKAELHELEHSLSYCTITAPISGYVSKICNTLYGAAHAGEPLFYIVDMDHLKVCFNVLENELARYENGASLSFTTISFPTERHQATVSAVSPVIDENGMAYIEATVSPHPHLAPGMTAFITVTAP